MGYPKIIAPRRLSSDVTDGFLNPSQFAILPAIFRQCDLPQLLILICHGDEPLGLGRFFDGELIEGIGSTEITEGGFAEGDTGSIYPGWWRSEERRVGKECRL